jgi:hypothetical protein
VLPSFGVGDAEWHPTPEPRDRRREKVLLVVMARSSSSLATVGICTALQRAADDVRRDRRLAPVVTRTVLYVLVADTRTLNGPTKYLYSSNGTRLEDELRDLAYFPDRGSPPLRMA